MGLCANAYPAPEEPVSFSQVLRQGGHVVAEEGMASAS